MLRRCFSRMVLLGLLVLTTPLYAADAALDAVSTDASVVVRLKNPKATAEKVASLVDQVVPGMGDQVRQQSQAIGIVISNPTLAGVNMEADWYVAIFANGGQEEPDVVFIIPSTDLKAMEDALDDKFEFTKHGKFGVYSESEDAIKDVTARLKGEGKSISTLIDKESTAVLDQGDLSVFINVPELVETYKDELDGLKTQAEAALNNIPDEAPGAPGINPKAIGDVFKKLLSGLVQGVQDTKGCTIAVTIGKEGVAFEDLVRVTAGSDTDKFLQKSAPSALAGLSSLPAGQLAYFGLQGDLSDVMKLSLSIMGALTGDNADKAKEFKAAMEDLSKLKFGSVVSSFALGDLEKGAIRTVTVTETSEPAKMRAASQKMFKAMGEISTGGIKQSYKFQADGEKYGTNSADVVTITTDLSEAPDPAAAAFMDRFMKMIYGPEGMTTRTVYLKDRVLQTAGGGKESMSQALDALNKKSAAASKSAVDVTRGKLNAKANILVMFDIAGTLSKAIELVAESGALPIPINAEMVKNLEIKSSYLGFSMGTEPAALRVKTVVPVEQIQGIAKLGMMFTALQAGGGLQN